MSHVDGVDDGIGYGVFGKSSSGHGVRGSAEDAVFDPDHGLNVGMYGTSKSGEGVFGDSTSGTGVSGRSKTGYGIFGRCDDEFGNGIYGVNDDGTAITGESIKGVGVYGQCHEGTGVFGESDLIYGVHGKSGEGRGVLGESATNIGVEGRGRIGVSASGASDNGIAVAALGGAYGFIGLGATLAGWFIGDVHVGGLLTKSGGGFKIDHPLDPSNKYLFHSFVESSEMKNVYDGVVVLGANGEADVILPDWFETLNKEFRYQLTPVNGPAPNLYIAKEITNRRFRIAGGTSGLKVCWLVTGTRQDAWAKANPVNIEQDKSDNERGYYLHPEVQGYPPGTSIEEIRFPDEIRQLRDMHKKST